MDENNIRTRIEEFIAYLKMSDREFARKCAIGETTISSAKHFNSKSLSSRNLEKIMATFPELNKEWLISGEGSMLSGSGLASLNIKGRRTSSKPRKEMWESYSMMPDRTISVVALKEHLVTSFPATSPTVAFCDCGYPFKVVAYAHFVCYENNREDSYVLPYLYDDAGVALSREKMHAFDFLLWDDALGKVIFSDYIFREDVDDFYALYSYAEPFCCPDSDILTYDEYCQLLQLYGLKIID